ncbi:MAG: M48 family metalloprotease [Elusimicrobia bacterium]|nr:M48 family metalloprotease [Elusimicrobiota bacterium]
MRRALSIILSLALVGLSAGTAPTQAWAQFRVEAVSARPGMPGGTAAAGVAVQGPRSLSGAVVAPVSLSASLPLSPVPGAVPVRPAAASAAALPAAPSPASASAAALPTRAQAAAKAPVAHAAPAPAARAPAGFERLREAFPGKASTDRRPGAPTRAPPASLESQAAGSRKLFDGSAMRPEGSAAPVSAALRGPRRSGLNAVSEEDAQVQAEGAPAAPAPLLEGRLDPGSFKLPTALKLTRAAALTAHYALLAAVPVLLAVGFGLVPAALGAAATMVRIAVQKARAPANGSVSLSEAGLRETREQLLRMRRGEPLSAAERADLDERAAPFEQLLSWGEATVEYLTGRAGLDPQRAPRVWLDESSRDLHWAASVGGRLDKSGAIYLGVGFVLRPLERAVGVLAHEMGHLFFGDAGWLRERLRMRGGWDGGFRTGLQDAGTAAAGSVLAYAVLHAALFAADPTLLLTGLAWAAGAVLSAAAALLAGLAATRQEELRADWFSAWLSDPSWLAAYLRDEAGGGRAPRPMSERLTSHLLSTHPAWETRVEKLGSYSPKSQAIREAVLPVSDSAWGLSGDIQAVVRGADENLTVLMAQRAAGAFDFRLYQGMDGALVVRAHPARGPMLAAAPGPAFESLLASVLAEHYPAARVESARAFVHPAFETLRGSALGRELLAELAEAPVSVRWEASWPADGPRAALNVTGEGAEVVLNAAVFWKASPKAVAAALAHELFHYKVLRRLRALGIGWLNLGGLEFERLAQGVGVRVFRELGGTAVDDVNGADGKGVYGSGFKRWARSEHESEVELLKAHGYSSFKSLASLTAMDSAALAAELGGTNTAESVSASLDAVWDLYRAEARQERLWAAFHPAAVLSARFSR